MLVSLEFALMMSGGGGAGVVRCGRVQRLILSMLLPRNSRQTLSLYPAFRFRDEWLTTTAHWPLAATPHILDRTVPEVPDT